jgi:Terminase large subunit, T4likevirus-type, N-terminal
MTPAMLNDLAMVLDPSLILTDLGMEADQWQSDVLRSTADRMLLLCSRQAGKSTATAALAIHTAVYQPDSLVLLLSPSLRQSGELFKKVDAFYDALEKPIPSTQESATTLALSNGSRVVSLPGSPDTIRGFSGVRLLIVDEAALTSDELFIAVSPMLAVSRGRLVALSTPLGRRGWFHDQWESASATWERFKVTAWDCPRIERSFLEEQRKLLGERWFRQEYECSFEETIDQVFSTDAINKAFETDEAPLFSFSGD